VTAICLKAGDHDLPQNVEVFSLGKETGRSRFKYVRNFYRYISSRRGQYDAVFVHMNQEYVLLGAFLWKLWGKRVYMWRNHHAGDWKTRLAVALCDRVFCTSRFSYTARFKKTVLMPIGIDTEKFSDKGGRVAGSVLFLARIAPVKRPDLLLRALAPLARADVPFSVSIYGDTLPKDQAYAGGLRALVAELGMADRVSFHPGVPNDQTVGVYSAHDIAVNLSTSGMFDKTIFEAMACGALSLSSNENLRGEVDPRLLYKEGDEGDLTENLRGLLSLSSAEKDSLRGICRRYTVERHSLTSLRDRLFDMMSRP
jgi:glycosyltransferase involved in cell wall biosynthesis